MLILRFEPLFRKRGDGGGKRFHVPVAGIDRQMVALAMSPFAAGQKIAGTRARFVDLLHLADELAVGELFIRAGAEFVELLPLVWTARALALTSTGRVTKLNSVVRPNMAMAIHSRDGKAW